MIFKRHVRLACLTLLTLTGTHAVAADYDLLLQGGHVIDGKNKLSAVRDVAIKDGKIAAVGRKSIPRGLQGP